MSPGKTIDEAFRPSSDRDPSHFRPDLFDGGSRVSINSHLIGHIDR